MGGAIQQFGPVTAAHLSMWAEDGHLMDAGGSGLVGPVENNANPGTLPGGLALVNTGLAYSVFSGYADAPYSDLSWGFDGAGNGLISLNPVGGGGALSLYFNINGALYQFPGTGTGGVLGPVSSVSSAIPLWNNTAGSLLKDSGLVWTQYPGPASPHLSAQIDNAFDDSALSLDSSFQLGGVFAGPAYARFAFAKKVTTAEVGILHNGISDTVYINTQANGLGNTLLSLNTGGSAAVGLQAYTQANQNYDYAVGANFQVSAPTGLTVKLNPLELDIQPVAGVTLVDSYGLIITIYNETAQGGIITGTVDGGALGFGLLIGGMATDGIGVGFNGAAGQNDNVLFSGFDSHNITCSVGAFLTANGGADGSNGQGYAWESTVVGSKAAYAYADTAGDLKIDTYTGGAILLQTGSHDPVTIGGAATLERALTSTYDGLAALPASQATAGSALTNNYAGLGEVDFWNLVNNEDVNKEGFRFYQKTGAGTTRSIGALYTNSTDTNYDIAAPSGKLFSVIISDSSNYAQVSTAATNGLLLSTKTAIKGTATNDSAAAGYYGELLTGQTNTVALVSTASKTITSVSLTAGDWDVEGTVQFNPAGGTTTTNTKAGVNTTTDTLPTPMTAGGYVEIDASTAASVSQTLQTGTQRVSLAGTTTVYLVAQATFGVSTMTASGFIRARRVR